ncbi:MAG: M20/M25/M40 family metallo-hydrolase [Planctomycetota bacterium]|nr:M20/M25/M40 family metallo-hydrolase [Planctomycetota bacterium]
MSALDAKARVLAIIDDDEQDLRELCLRLGNARDYAGEELEVGETVVQWLREANVEAHLQFISETSVNAIGVLPGSGDREGGGRSLILNAHMDTQGSVPLGGDEAERRLRGAWAEGDLVYGAGLANDKAQLAAELIAIRSLRRAEIGLKESLFVTGVAQETSAPPLDGEEIERWSGIGPRMSQVREGHGAKWLVEHGVVADFALVGEVTDFKLSLGQAGYLRLRIAVPGNVRYTPLLHRGENIADNPNPFERAGHVIVALEAWAKEYERTDVLDFGRGTIVPHAQVLEVCPGGLAFTELTDYCHIFFDVRLVPGAKPADIQQRVQRAVDALGLDCNVAPYDYRRGHLAEHAEPLIEALADAHRQVFGQDLDDTDGRTLSTWRDTNAFNEAGIPAICYGARTRDSNLGGGLAGESRPMAIADLIALAKVYALTALGVCQIDA